MNKNLSKIEYQNNSEILSSSFPVQLGYFFAGMTSAFLLDNSVRRYIKLNPANNEIFILEAGHAYGDIYYNLYFSSGLFLTGYITENKKITMAGKSMVESILLGSLATISLKYIFGRSRPYKGEGNMKFNFFETENENNSLPSGHVMTAVTTSTILSKAIGNTYISILLYSISSLTIYQRLATDNHWFSDVFLGSVIGYFFADYVYTKNMNEFSKGTEPSLVPFFNHDGVGLYFIYCF